MGIIKAVTQAIGGAFADQWLEVYEADNMGDQTVFARGVLMRKGQNRKGTEDTVTNGSVIHVYDNQFMLLVDGGKIVDYTAEPGYYKVDNSSLPSMFNGQFGDSLKESFDRIRFGGQTPTAQKVFFINLQEIKGIKFGTRQPINYFDSFYNAELFLRAHGNYSIKIVNPLQFYAEAIPRNKDHVEIDEINEQYLSEFLEALQSAINQMSADGIRISYVSSKARELGQYMSSILDQEWNQTRGMEIQAVGLTVSYNEDSQKLINMRNEGAMLSDPTIREGYVQGAVARGLEAAGSNANGSMAGFMGMGMASNVTGGVMGAASNVNLAQMQMQQQNVAATQAQMAGATGNAQAMGSAGNPQAAAPAGTWTCSCGQVNSGKFCSECGKPAPAAEWTCSCGQVNSGKFCSNCGKPRA
ncbi:MAG: SPFH domain-containing protein [Lachnospiraceae bacterium]|nr:SPFH domain-containing protein [Agathobacter sp.]MDD6290505.1 SPFH domain-containing protein [Lachnospiraceae bacterium]